MSQLCFQTKVLILFQVHSVSPTQYCIKTSSYSASRMNIWKTLQYVQQENIQATHTVLFLFQQQLFLFMIIKLSIVHRQLPLQETGTFLIIVPDLYFKLLPPSPATTAILRVEFSGWVGGMYLFEMVCMSVLAAQHSLIVFHLEFFFLQCPKTKGTDRYTDKQKKKYICFFCFLVT